jgi:hypothetical protein
MPGAHCTSPPTSTVSVAHVAESQSGRVQKHEPSLCIDAMVPVGHIGPNSVMSQALAH